MYFNSGVPPPKPSEDDNSGVPPPKLSEDDNSGVPPPKPSEDDNFKGSIFTPLELYKELLI